MSGSSLEVAIGIGMTGQAGQISPPILGTAAWTIPKAVQTAFPVAGSHLERYAAVFRGVEINSSFYREHEAKTYARWAATVPSGFRFAVKLAQRFTHESELRPHWGEVDESLTRIRHLGEALGPLLVQLPPRQKFHPARVERFFAGLRKIHAGEIAIEPRDVGWAEREARELLRHYRISQVHADPERCPSPGDDWPECDFRYLRLHGSPVIYRSAYGDSFLTTLAQNLRAYIKPTWVIFDNTTLGFATNNALGLQSRVQRGERSAD